jgi:hypothetical protein
MKPTTVSRSLFLEVEEVENRKKPGGCETSSSTSPLCTCPCREPLIEDSARG